MKLFAAVMVLAVTAAGCATAPGWHASWHSGWSKGRMTGESFEADVRNCDAQAMRVVAVQSGHQGQAMTGVRGGNPTAPVQRSAEHEKAYRDMDQMMKRIAEHSTQHGDCDRPREVSAEDASSPENDRPDDAVHAEVNLRGLGRVGAALIAAVALGVESAAAQTAIEPDAHHPAGATSATLPAAPTPPGVDPHSAAPPVFAPPAGAADMRTMAEQMMRAMHGTPPSPPLVARALNASRLSAGERDRLRVDAERQLVRGQAQARRAARDLEDALSARDRGGADRALAELREGASDVETARAVMGALAAPPAETEERALNWFKRELRLVDAVSQRVREAEAQRWLIVAALAVVALGGVALYLYKVGRSVRWLARLSGADRPR